MDFVMASLTIESLWLSDRALEQGIGRSGVRFVIGTQNFFPCATPVTRRKTSSLTPSLLTKLKLLTILKKLAIQGLLILFLNFAFQTLR